MVFLSHMEGIWYFVSRKPTGKKSFCAIIKYLNCQYVGRVSEYHIIHLQSLVDYWIREYINLIFSLSRITVIYTWSLSLFPGAKCFPICEGLESLGSNQLHQNTSNAATDVRRNYLDVLASVSKYKIELLQSDSWKVETDFNQVNNLHLLEGHFTWAGLNNCFSATFISSCISAL